jgi:hypothetical protein
LLSEDEESTLQLHNKALANSWICALFALIIIPSNWGMVFLRIPYPLEQVSGTIHRVTRECDRHGYLVGIQFSLVGGHGEHTFAYRSPLPNMEWTATLIEPGRSATVGVSNINDLEIWALTLDHDVVLEATAARQARSDHGKMGCGAGVVLSLMALYFARQYRKQGRAISRSL